MTVGQMKQYIPGMKKYLSGLYMRGSISESIIRSKAIEDLEEDFDNVKDLYSDDSEELLFEDESEVKQYEETYELLLQNGYIDNSNDNKSCIVINLNR